MSNAKDEIPPVNETEDDDEPDEWAATPAAESKAPADRQTGTNGSSAPAAQVQ